MFDYASDFFGAAKGYPSNKAISEALLISTRQASATFTGSEADAGEADRADVGVPLY